jgi:hypothetical protein
MNTEEANKVFASCNRPSTLKVVCTFPDGEEYHFPLEPDYDEIFMEWLTNGSNEHPLEYWQKYWRVGKVTKQDINEQNTFVMGFLEALHQSDKCPPRMMEEEYEVRVGRKKEVSDLVDEIQAREKDLGEWLYKIKALYKENRELKDNIMKNAETIILDLRKRLAVANARLEKQEEERIIKLIQKGADKC